METVGTIKTLGIVGHNRVLGYLCTLKESEEFISIDNLEVGKSYPLISFHFNTEKGAGDNFYTDAMLVKESDHPDANLYLKLELDHAIRYARIVGTLDIFKKIKEKGLGTIAINNRAFTVPADQILIKGIHYPSVERVNPKLDIKRLFGDKAILADDGYYVLLNDEDMAKHEAYCNSCIDMTPIDMIGEIYKDTIKLNLDVKRHDLVLGQTYAYKTPIRTVTGELTREIEGHCTMNGIPILANKEIAIEQAQAEEE